MKTSRTFDVHNTRKYGMGVYAGRDIKKGEIIHVLSGEKMTLGQLVERVLTKKERIDDPFQIGRRTFIYLDKLSRTFNHSCDPTGGIRKTSELFALRDIQKGEQITYDYSMVIAPTDWKMRCFCGSKKCRKIVGDVRSVPESQKRYYEKHGAVQRYMKALIQELRARTYRTPRYEELALERLGKHRHNAK
jgi:hypothetical protein